MQTLRMTLLMVVGGGVLGACAEPGEGASAAVDVGSDTGADATASDAVGDTGTADGTSAPDATAVPETDAAAETSLPVGSADNPTVGCLADQDCSDGKLCCTLALSYLSGCVAAADCHAGLHDACLTDEQCAARRPGEWTTCCHDLRDRNYCAPVAETCQPQVPCETPADCQGNGNDTCCSEHPYYGVAYCTNTFFAKNPERDCP